VLVDGHRERRCGVAEPLAHDLQWDTGLEEQRGVRVAEIGEANDWST
jgi:hypothetical protein